MSVRLEDLKIALQQVRARNYGAAIPVLEKAIQQNATNRAICLALAEAYRNTGRWQESAKTLKPFLDDTPGDHRARYYYGMALLESGHPRESKLTFEALISAKAHVPHAYYMLGRSLMGVGQVDKAVEAFRESHKLLPTALTLQSLSNDAFMRDDKDGFDKVLQDSPIELKLAAVAIYLSAEMVHDAERLWRQLPKGHQDCADGQNLRAMMLLEMDKVEEALACAKRATHQQPDELKYINTLILAHFANNDPKSALQALSHPRSLAPLDQSFIAHELTAFRLLNDKRYNNSADPDRFIKVYDLPVPEGYASIEEFNAAFADAIASEHSYTSHPINQSLRNGTQSTQSILAMDHPAVRAYRKALWEPIQSYLGEMGHEDGHVFLARNEGSFEFAGCWSVRLFWGGHHVNHVHPNGWISSAYYVDVPPEVETTKDKAGWIKFGEPPYKTSPKLKPEKWIKPKAGQLVLFPSYIWHGTAPLTENALRVTAPFDLVPA